MKKIILIITILFFTGCATTTPKTGIPTGEKISKGLKGAMDLYEGHLFWKGLLK